MIVVVHVSIVMGVVSVVIVTANIALGRGNGNTQNDSKDDCLHLWDTFQQERYIMLMHLEAI